MAITTDAYTQFLDALPTDRRAVVDAVWQFVRQHISAGYTEGIEGKFLTCKSGDDWYLALANQKNYISLYLIPLYTFPAMKDIFDAGGKKVKMGKSCLNFLQTDDLPMEAIGQIIGTYPADEFSRAVAQIRADGRAERKAANAKTTDH